MAEKMANLKFIRNSSKLSQLRNIEIAILYHSRKFTLKEIGEKFNLSRERIRQVHAVFVRGVLRQFGEWKENSSYLAADRSENTLRRLLEWKKWLENNG